MNSIYMVSDSGMMESQMCSSQLTGTVYNSSHNKLPVQLKTVQVNYSSTSEKCHVLQSNTGEKSWSVPTFIDKVKKKKSVTVIIYFWMLLFLSAIRLTPGPLQRYMIRRLECIHAQKLLWAATVWKLQLLLSKVPRNVHLNAKSSANKVNLFCLRFILFKSFFEIQIVT